MRASDCPCLGCTPETGRHSECHSSCVGYKSFLDKYKKEKKKEEERKRNEYELLFRRKSKKCKKKSFKSEKR